MGARRALRSGPQRKLIDYETGEPEAAAFRQDIVDEEFMYHVAQPGP